MVSSNQRSINEGISKVIGSSNRGFITLDPERQPRIVDQVAKATSTGNKTSEFRPPQAQPGTGAKTGSSSR
jgi:hypothetical protein